MEEETEKSEVARFRRQQALEEESMRLVFSGYAVTSRHDFITARMQRGGERILQLIAEGKHDEAQVLMNSENWGVEVDATTVVIGGEGENHEQTQPKPSANIGAQLP